MQEIAFAGFFFVNIHFFTGMCLKFPLIVL